MVALQHFFDAAIEALDHAVGLRRLRRRQPMLDVEGCAQRVKLVLTGRGALMQTEETISELLSIVGQNRADA